MPIKTALVVDDSKSARLILRKMLTKQNLEAETVETGEEAIEYLRETRPDVIFMDHMMPGMNGLETTRVITTNQETANIPVVMFTSKEDDDYLQTAREHGASAILKKPPKAGDVQKVIAEISDISANHEIITDTHEEMENTMNAVIQPPAINIEEVEALARTTAESVAKLAAADSVEQLVAPMMQNFRQELVSELQDNSQLSEAEAQIQSLKKQVEALQSELADNLASLRKEFESSQADTGQTEAIRQLAETVAKDTAGELAGQVATEVASEVSKTTAEATAEDVAACVSRAIVEDSQKAPADSVQLSVGQYRRLQWMAGAGFAAGLASLVAMFI